MSGPRRFLACLHGAILVGAAAVAAAVTPGNSLVQQRQQEVGRCVIPGPDRPPDESLRVDVKAEREVVEGESLRFLVTLPERLVPTGFALTYAVDPGASTAREGVDYEAPGGRFEIAPGATVGTFEIQTLRNPRAGDRSLLVVVSSDAVVAGSAVGTILAGPPDVRVSSTPVVAGNDLVFDVSIDPAAAVRGPWTYSWRLGGDTLVVDPSVQQTGTLQFDAEGRASDQIRIMTRAIGSAGDSRTVRLTFFSGDVEYGEGEGRVDPTSAAQPVEGPTTGPPPPPPPPTQSQPPPDWTWPLILAALGGLLVGVIGTRLFTPKSPPPPPADPIVLPFAVETSFAPAEFDPVDVGVPELEIETVADTPELALPAGLPTGPVGG